MTYFPMMKMTKVKEVSAFQITMSMYLFSAKAKDANPKNKSMLRGFWDRVEC